MRDDRHHLQRRHSCRFAASGQLGQGSPAVAVIPDRKVQEEQGRLSGRPLLFLVFTLSER